MLRVTVDLVPHGVSTPRRVGVAVVGQVGHVGDSRARYAAAVWDDVVHATPAIAVVDHDRADGLWELVRAVLEAVVAGDRGPALGESTLAALERALAGVPAGPAVDAKTQRGEVEEGEVDEHSQA